METDHKTKNRAVFLDRDGTLVEEVNYLSKIEDLHFFCYTEKSVELLKQNGFLVVVITNQSGIGRGMFEETAMHEIHGEIQRKLGGNIEAFYFCPHLPDAGCPCRKPNTEMLEKAAEKFSIDLENSWMIGDKVMDVGAGFNAGTRTALVLTGHGKEQVGKLEKQPDIIAETLLDAVEMIISLQETARAEKF